MSPPPTPLPIHIRPATPHDIPTIATISVRAFWNDPLYAYTNPWRLSHPDSFRNHFLRRTRERYWTPSWRFVVAEVDTSEARGEASEGEGGDGGEGNGKREVVGFTCWHREHGDLKKGVGIGIVGMAVRTPYLLSPHQYLLTPPEPPYQPREKTSLTQTIYRPGANARNPRKQIRRPPRPGQKRLQAQSSQVDRGGA
ncbi:uncharacterized protein KY384_005716 [Bacidia gigantensis]|uniref:uncharacterized protein n=1 Tax=Bacidia gigantensis TaxID=2732470 RepID=UPI001D036B92|nr:uncharacterized protein KY384_005716 [Bacidia gigantensis]KAG8529081.1 hypothetical protein KY384_005716 [Bacidia gigantensis]